jgi:hypothetical protein
MGESAGAAGARQLLRHQPTFRPYALAPGAGRTGGSALQGYEPMSRPVTPRRPSPRGAANRAGRAVSAAVKRNSRAERAKQIERLERRGLGTREIAAGRVP